MILVYVNRDQDGSGRGFLDKNIQEWSREMPVPEIFTQMCTRLTVALPGHQTPASQRGLHMPLFDVGAGGVEWYIEHPTNVPGPRCRAGRKYWSIASGNITFLDYLSFISGNF